MASSTHAPTSSPAVLAPGDRVATLTGNSPEHVVTFFACAKAGAMLLPISWRLSPHEVAYQLDDADATFFLVEGEYEALADQALELARVTPARAIESNRLLQGRPEADDPLLLIYTSGTTGRPKGALLTHANCFWTNLSFDLATGVSGHDVVLQCLPQFHCGGWNVHPLLAWWKGARLVLERTFDADRALGLIEQKRITTMMGVPAHYLFMSQSPRFAGADLSSLRCAVVGGAPMPVALLDSWAARGVDIVQGYGLTEAAPNVLCVPPEDARRKAGWAGKPYPYVECALGDDSELLVRGPNVFPGYWRNSEATAEALRGGWLHTGDVAERDDEGFYRILGRIKELVISGGENIYPAEIEDVLHAHPSVVEAAVVGVPDERWGEVCAAFVVLADGTTEDELAALLPRAPRALQGAEVVPRRRHAAAELDRQDPEVRAPRACEGGARMTDVIPTSVDGRPLTQRGLDTRRKLLDAAEQIFGEVGFPDASIVKITEAAGVAQGTFYLYFASKKEVFDELVVDLNRRVRHAMKEASDQGLNRLEAELLGFEAYFRFTREHPALYRIIRQAEFVSPEMLRYHYDRLSEGYVGRCRRPPTRGEIGAIDPEVTAWALMGIGELIGMRWILWGDASAGQGHARARADHPLRPRAAGD